MPAAADLALLAQRVLLGHAVRHDPEHALADLAAGLCESLALEVVIEAAPPAAWQVRQRRPGVAAPAPAAGAPWRLPLRRLGQEWGWLTLATDGRAAPADLPPALQPVLDTAAALLMVRAQPVRDGGAYVALLRAALLGAGTFVWEWDVDSDRLGDIDEGFRLLGYEPGELGRQQRDWDQLIHAGDRDANHEAYLRHARGESPIYEHAYRARHRDGSWRWMLERGSIVDRDPAGQPRRMVGTQTDITAQRAAQEQAQTAQDRLAKLAEQVPGILFQYQRWPDGRECYPYLSQRAAHYGLDTSALGSVGGSTYGLVKREDRRAVLQAVNASDASLQPWSMEFRFALPDGERWMRSVATPQREPDGSTLWHGYMADITEERALEQARRAQLDAESASRAKSQFLSRVSHELRTPLNAILGFAQILQIGPGLDPTQRHQLGLIRGAGEHLLAMVGDLLDLTGIESGQVAMDRAPVELAPLVAECVAMLRAPAEAAGVRWSVDAPPGLAAQGDRRRLKQVLLNLLSNAIKYGRPGGWVRVRAAPRDDAVVLAVRDEGAGLSAAQQQQLFQPFNRLDQAHGAQPGTGLGLALSRVLLQAMAGDIEVDSAPGRGSEFRAVLPAAPDGAAAGS